MVIHRGAKPHLYLTEWMERKGISDTALGGRLGVAQATVWRWRHEQWRLNPPKIMALAHALGIEPEDLYRRPDRESIDGLLREAPDQVYEAARDMVKRLTGRR